MKLKHSKNTLKTMNKSLLNQLRILAILEGISYLLFAVTMPIKYIYEIKEPNYYVGMAHGVLFVGYCLWVVLVAMNRKWSFGKTIICLAASLFPFCTFIVDSKILKPESIR